MPFIEYNGKKILFIHIPRTGGSTIENLLNVINRVHFKTFGFISSMKVTPQHLTADEIFALFGKNFFDYCFTIVRNPFSKIESKYRIEMTEKKRTLFPDPQDFNLWFDFNISHFLKDEFYKDRHFLQQYRFISKEVNIFRYEQGLSNISEQVLKDNNLGPSVELPHIYKSEPIEVDWDIASRNRVYDIYRQDFELFDFQ